MAEQQSSTVATASGGGLWCGIKMPIVAATGDKWSGKTVFVSSIDPQNTLMVDLELSSESYGFIQYKKRISLYHELSQRVKDRAPNSLDCWLWFNELIESIKPGDFSVVAVDPINDIENGLAAWVYENGQAVFGHTKKQYDYASGLLQGDISSYWKLKLGILAAKIETLAFTTHIGSVWGTDGKPLPGKTKPKGRPVLTELASLYLEMSRKPNNNGIVPDIPMARVIKSRLMVGEFSNGEMKMYPVLGGSVPDCTPNKIREYIRNPIGKRTATDAEKAAPEVNLTEDEKLLLKSQIVGEQLQIEQSKSSRMELLAAAARRNTTAAAVVASQPIQAAANPGAEIAAAIINSNSSTAAAATESAATEPEKAKRTRRTKEQIAADEAKESAEKAAKETANENADSIAAAVTITDGNGKSVDPATLPPDAKIEVGTVVTGNSEAPFNPSGSVPTIHQTVNAQLAELQRADPVRWTAINIESTLMKRFGVNGVLKLSAEQAESLRKSLWDVLTKMGLPGEGITSGN